MNEESTKVIHRVIERLEEILNGSPWKTRDALKDFIEKLQEAIPPKEEPKV